MNLDVDMGDVSSDLADRVRDLLIENLVLKRAVEKLAARVKEVESENAVIKAELSISDTLELAPYGDVPPLPLQ